MSFGVSGGSSPSHTPNRKATGQAAAQSAGKTAIIGNWARGAWHTRRRDLHGQHSRTPRGASGDPRRYLGEYCVNRLDRKTSLRTGIATPTMPAGMSWKWIDRLPKKAPPQATEGSQRGERGAYGIPYPVYAEKAARWNAEGGIMSGSPSRSPIEQRIAYPTMGSPYCVPA